MVKEGERERESAGGFKASVLEHGMGATINAPGPCKTNGTIGNESRHIKMRW